MSETLNILSASCRKINGKWFDVIAYADERIVITQVSNLWLGWSEKYKRLQEARKK